MRLTQFQTIQMLENCKSLSECAEKLYLSQPTLSKSIQELEDELGFQILIRNKSGIRFTSDGLEVLAHVKEIMQHVESIKNINRNIHTDVCGVFSFASTRFIGNEVLSRVILSMKEHYPNLTIQFQEDYSRSIIHGVISGELDFGIIMRYQSGSTVTEELEKDTELRLKQIYTDDVCLCVGKHHPLAHKKSVTLEQLVPYQYVSGGNPKEAALSRQFLQPFGYSQEVEIINSFPILLEYLSTTTCFTSMPRHVYESRQELQKMLKVLPVTNLHWECSIDFVFLDEESELLQSFIREFKQNTLM